MFYRKDLFEAEGIAVPQTEDEYLQVVKFIGWFTSKENEIRRIKGGTALSNARMSTFASPEFEQAYPPEFVKAQKEMMPLQRLTILQVPEWPEIGDYLGIKLEELFTKAFAGEKYDVQAALDDAVKYAKEALAKK
jgi:multiple sugar transport system substrate-binding protein